MASRYLLDIGDYDRVFTLPETIMAPEDCWLKDENLFRDGL